MVHSLWIDGEVRTVPALRGPESGRCSQATREPTTDEVRKHGGDVLRAVKKVVVPKIAVAKLTLVFRVW